MRTTSETSKGIIFGFGAYLIWGTFPLFVEQASFVSTAEIVVWRIIFGFLFALLLVTVTRSWPQLILLVREPRKLGWMVAAAGFIYVNWMVYVYSIASNQVIEGSLGYFINPLFTILLAVVFLKERLNWAQRVALAIALLAVVILTVDYGRPPLIAFTLALSFGMYGFAKKRLGARMGALHSFTLESGLLLPLSLVQLVVISSLGPVLILSQGLAGFMAVFQLGVLTTIPLVLFGAAAGRVPLATLGFMQYLTPTGVFLLGLFYFQEPMPPVRWVGFTLVWLGLLLLTADALRTRRKNHKIIENL